MTHRQGHNVKATDGIDEAFLTQGADEDSSVRDRENSDEQAPVELTIDDTVEPEIEELGVDALKALLDAERQKTEDEHNRFLRALADFSNYKRRQEEREASLQKFAARELILKMLSVMDDFQRALTSAEESRSFDALHGGLELTVKKLQTLLEAEGVTPIEAEGQTFNPMYHEAVMRVEDSEHPADTVVAELQKGYMLGSEVIRPSMVTVAVES